MGIPIMERQHLYIETTPWFANHAVQHGKMGSERGLQMETREFLSMQRPSYEISLLW